MKTNLPVYNNRRKSRLFVTVACIVFALIQGMSFPAQAQTNKYLSVNGSGSKTGASWTNAAVGSTYLSSLAGTTPANVHIFLKAGTYTYPATTGTIGLGNSFLLQGGYPTTAVGIDTSGYDPVANATIINVNGSSTFADQMFNDGGQSNATATLKGIQFAGGATGSMLVNITGSVASGSKYNFTDLTVSNFRSIGAIYISTASTINVTNNVFSSNASGGNPGAALFVTNGNSTLTIANSAFTGNSSSSGISGGAVSVACNTTISNSSFCSNSDGGTNGGGALSDYTYSTYQSTFTITNTTFNGNTATNSGGAIWKGNGTLIVTGSNFYNNSATSHGGGAIAKKLSSGAPSGDMVTNCNFYHNSTTNTVVSSANLNGGGAISLVGGTQAFTITNCVFDGNSSSVSSSVTPATGTGGAIFYGNTSNTQGVNISGTTFVNNTTGGSTTAVGSDVILYDGLSAYDVFNISSSKMQLASPGTGVYKAFENDGTSPYRYIFGSGNTFSNTGGSLGSLTFNCPTNINLTISGTVWNDANHNVLIDGTETGANAGGPLYVNLVNTSNVIVASALVASNGTFSMSNIPQSISGYTLVLTNTATGTSPGPLPTGWVNTGQIPGTNNTASQSGTKGVITTSNDFISGADFGIFQCSTESPALSITATASTNLVCASSPVTVTLTSTPSGGITPYASYLWSGSGVSPTNTQNTSATPTASSTYSVTVTDGVGCTATGTTALVTYDNTMPSISPNCSGGGASLQLIEINGVSWIWTTTSGGRFYTDASYSVNSDSDVSHLQAPFINKAGSYTVQMVDVNGCSSSATIPVTTSSCTVLASNMTGLSAQRAGNMVALQWQAANVADIKEFIVERSTDGNNFITAGKVIANSSSNYHFDDDVSLLGCIKLYYRVKETGTDNSSYTSNIIPVNCNANDASQYVLNIYPSPLISGSKVTVNYSLPAGVSNAQIVLTNILSGQQYSYVLSNTGNGINTATIPVSSNVAAGTYFIRIVSDKWVSKTIKIIKQ